MGKDELAVIIPVYNEEKSIENVINKWDSELNSLHINYKIHVYNDGSKDGTLSVLNKLANKYPRLTIHNKANSGHGPTILQGYRENSDSDWIFQVDSDDEMGTESFKTIWSKRDAYRLVIGRRVRPDQPFVRRIISFISRISVRLLYGNRIYDVNSPYRLMHSATFKKLFFSIPEDTFAPNTIIAGAASLGKVKCCEIAVQHNNRIAGEVSIKKLKLLKAAIKSFVQLYRFRMKNGPEGI